MKQLAGLRFGRLLALEPVYVPQLRWRCRCDCGTLRDVCTQSLTDGRTQSCGCLHREITSTRTLKHGESKTGPKGESVEYRLWGGMINRCTNPNDHLYEFYGARGIKVCARWRVFEDFLADVGRRPGKNLTLDREDNEKGYEPGNVKWATRKEQARNRRSTCWVEWEGRRVKLIELAELKGVPIAKVRNRLRKGMSLARALSTTSLRS